MKKKKLLYRWLLGIVVYFTLVGSLIPAIKVHRIDIKESDIAKYDIFSPCDFSVVDKKEKDASPQYKMISKGENIIRKGEKVTKEQSEYISALNLFLGKSRLNRLKQIAGVCLSFLIIIFILDIYINKFLQHILSNITSLAIVSLITIGFVVVNKIILAFSLPPYLIPTAAVAIMLTILLNGRIAFIINLALCIFIGIATDYKFDYFFVATVGGITAIFCSSQAKRRIDIIKIGFIVSLVNMATIISIDLHKGIILSMMFEHIKWGFANGIVSSFIAAGLLPILEYSFNIPTDAKLMELLDLNQPVLKQLSKEAPGTYQSCIAVGTLAEAASDSIKANSLLTKVASYYHDIGKTKKASYFIENQIQNKNIHNKITPVMSNLVLISHVKDGVKSAKEAKLPKLIIDIIEQHHGTTLTSFFFQRALEKDNHNSVKEENFRYPGPKPQTKEAAIVMLADSVEAASRTLNDPTSARIKTMVEKIINSKFSDHQLDESNLTLKDLSKIAKSFTHSLISMFHSRIEYPDANTNGSNGSRDNKSSKKDKNK